jgi:phosphoribosylanthranilate isomerase
MRLPRHETRDSRLETSGLGDFLAKVCGITTLEDALLSVETGANCLGFNFYRKSPRFIEPKEVGEIISQLPKGVLTVGIVVLDSRIQAECVESGVAARGLVRELSQAGIDAIQIHGVRSELEIPELGFRTFVATSPDLVGEFPHFEIVIDTSWGTGTQADWEQIAALLDRPYILSGGLTPENVGRALRKLSPTGVDVCSGVESSPGKKDPRKLMRFLSTVRSYCDDSGSNR